MIFNHGNLHFVFPFSSLIINFTVHSASHPWIALDGEESLDDPDELDVHRQLPLCTLEFSVLYFTFTIVCGRYGYDTLGGWLFISCNAI
jgi:hypothetical protein